MESELNDDEEIPTLPAIIETDDVGRLSVISSNVLSMQPVYAYVNKIYCDLKSMIDKLSEEINTFYDNIASNISSSELKTNAEVASSNSRCLILESDFTKINHKISNLQGLKNEYIKTEMLTNTKKDIEKQSESTTNELKRIIRENLRNANLQHDQFINFKKEYEKDVLPILNRINTDDLKGASITG